MGWTTMHYTGTAKQFFIDRYKNEPNFEIVDIAIKNFRDVYIAVKNLKDGYIYCQTYMLYRAPKSSYENFGYKPISEFMGPVNAQCPKRILDKLTPLDELVEKFNYTEDGVEYARGWRKRCLESIEFSKKLSSGAVIKTDVPLDFTSGNSYQYFKKKGKRWYAIANYGTKAEIEAPVSIGRIDLMSFKFV